MPPENILQRLREAEWTATGVNPKHMQLSAALAEAIVSEQCTPGSRLPTETELAAATSLSLGTVQRALRTLVEDGVVDRRRGHGSFVARRRTLLGDPFQLRFLEEDGATVLPISLQVVSRKRTGENGPWSTPLGQRGDDVLEIDRLIGVGGRFTAFARFFVRAGRFPLLDEEPLAALDGVHFSRLLAETAHVAEVDQRLTIEAFSNRICRLIDAAPGMPGLVLRAFARAGDEVVYVQEIYIPQTDRPLKFG